MSTAANGEAERPGTGAKLPQPQAYHGPLERWLGGVMLLRQLRCSTGQLTRSEILELTVGEAPKRVRCRPDVICTTQKFGRNSDLGSRCQQETRRYGDYDRRAVVQPQIVRHRSC